MMAGTVWVGRVNLFNEQMVESRSSYQSYVKPFGAESSPPWRRAHAARIEAGHVLHPVESCDAQYLWPALEFFGSSGGAYLRAMTGRPLPRRYMERSAIEPTCLWTDGVVYLV